MRHLKAIFRHLMAVVAGVGQAGALADPAGQAHGWLQVLSLAVLCSLLLRVSFVRNLQTLNPLEKFMQGAIAGWWFATGWLCATFWWLYISMHTYGGMPGGLAALAVVALAGALAIYYALACGLWVLLMHNLPTHKLWGWGSLAFAALWTLAELMRGQWLTGFPWGAVGYAHVDSWLSGYAPWVGVYGVGALAACLAMAFSATLANWREGVSNKRRFMDRANSLLPVASLSLLMALPWTWTFFQGDWTRSAGTAQVRLLQGNIAQDEKFIPGRGIEDALRWYGQELQDNTTSLVVAPETAIPLLPYRLPAGYWAQLTQRYATNKTQLALVGLPMGSFQTGYSNSVVSLGPAEMHPYRYDKHHLVPFGEFIPPMFQWFLRLMDIPLGDFQRGNLRQPALLWQNQRLAPNICYEDLFGEELAAQFVGSASQAGPNEVAPTVLVNLSNIGWFGNTIAIDQHLNISRMRTLELQRPMLRATNTGATAIIDHQGHVVAQLPRHTRGALIGQFEGRTGLTPYAWWAGHWGLMPLWGLCVWVLAWVLWRRLRNR
jgi:apolipoprotein N-acyltransferase